MSNSLKESIKWQRRGGFTLLTLLAISLVIIWSGIAEIPEKGLLGASAISVATFGGFGGACLIKARGYSQQLKESKNE